MGNHQRADTIKVIDFIMRVGRALGYAVDDEEPMFRKSEDSPILDVTWRASSGDKFPLFIFEIDSEANKSAIDNAVKVLAQKTSQYQKPLFLFHVFVEDPPSDRRIKYLKESYDDVNYETFALGEASSHCPFVFAIIDQHLRVAQHLDLPSLLGELDQECPLQIEALDVLLFLWDLGYDSRSGANFLAELEVAIMRYGESTYREFMELYLPEFLARDSPPPQLYPWNDTDEEDVQVRIVHLALVLLMRASKDYDLYFAKIQEEENDFWGEPLFSNNFGSSSWDNDAEIYSDWPILLTMLAAAFTETKMSSYFSQKLKALVTQALNHFGTVTPYPMIWLAIASQIAHDREGYEFAAEIVDQIGGIPLRAIVPDYSAGKQRKVCSYLQLSDMVTKIK